MRLGVYIFPTDTTIQPVELAREVEARGFDSLWFPEHSHIPASRRTPWGGREGAPPLPEEYWRTHDQFVALAAAAAVTTKIRLATGITLVAQRDPLLAGQGGRLARHDLRWALHLRHRLRLEHRGDGEPRGRRPTGVGPWCGRRCWR